MVYLVDSAGARITDQVDLFPGRRGAGQDLLEPGPRLRLDPAGLRAVRAVARPAARTSRRSATWWRWSTATPRCTSAPTGWSRWSPARRPRWRRWAGRRCTAPSPASGTSCARPRPTRSTWSGATCRTCRRTGRGHAAGRRRRSRPRPRSTCAALVPASERQAFDMRRYVKGLLDEGSFFEIQALWAQGADRRLRPAGRRGRRRGRQQLDVQGRRALRRLGRQGDPVRAALRRVQRAAALPRPTCPASWSARRWRSRASSGTARR